MSKKVLMYLAVGLIAYYGGYLWYKKNKQMKTPDTKKV
jgi:hypothetical protein